MAATDLERLVVQLSADIKRYENALNRAQGQTNRQARSIERRFEKMNKAIVSSSSAAAAGFAKAFAVIGGAQGLKTLSDSATKVDNSLKVAGLSGAELEKVYKSLLDAANKNATPIETLVNLYGKLALVQKELGVSSEQIESYAKNVAVALRVGGQSSTEAAGALTQLGQAMGAGIVRAEEFTSLIEGAPTILQAASAGIKEAEGSVAKLRNIMLDGKLSSKAFFDGFQAGAPMLEEKLAGSVMTIEGRLTSLTNNLINAARDFNTSAKAGETFGNEIDRVSQFLNGLDFDNFISEIEEVAAAFNSAKGAVNGFFAEAGRLSGLSSIGDTLRQTFGGPDGNISLFGGALTISGTDGNQGLADRRRREIEGLISQETELQRKFENAQKGTPGNATAEHYQQQIADVQAARKKLADEIILLNTPFKPLTGAPNVPAERQSSKPTVQTISVSDPKYTVADTGTKKTKSGRGSTDDLQREIQQIKDRTLALQSETEAQAGLNPLLNDYGFAVEKAAAKHDLLTAAQQAGKTVTPELAAEIDGLATAYANAVVASEKLAESQDKIRQRAEEAREFNKDLTRGIVDGFLEGKDAADIFADALSKIGDRLLDLAFNAAFQAPSSGGIDFGGLFKGLFREKGGPVKAGQPYIVGEKRPELFLPNQSGRIVPQVPTAPKLPSVSSKSASSATSVSIPITIDATGADAAGLARVERQVAQLKAELPKRVMKAVEDGQKRRII